MADIDQDKVKDALDKFEQGEYVDSEEEIKDQVRKSVKSHLKNKLGLDGETNGEEPESTDNSDDTNYGSDNDDPDNSGDDDNTGDEGSED